MTMLCILRTCSLLLATAVLLAPSAIGHSESPPSGGQGPIPEVRGHLEEARALGLYRDRGPDLLHPALLAAARRAPESESLAWVFFTDKGLGTRGAYETAIREFQSRLGTKARTRRAALGAGLGADFRDLPVAPVYVDALLRAGFRVRRVSRWMNAVSVEAKAGNLAALSALPFVRYAEPVLVKRGSSVPDEVPGEPGDGASGPDSNRERAPAPLGTTACVIPVADPVEAAFYGPSFNQLGEIQVLDLHRLGYSGAGVRVMVLDTGFLKSHPAFAHTRWIAEWDFVQEDGNTQNQAGDSSTQQDHGTGTWGVAGGYAPGALIGPAFAAEWVLAKTEDVVHEVRAEEDNYVAALEWADTLGVDVTTASLAYFTFDDLTGYTQAQLDGDTAVITRAVDIAVAKGIACVNSAGNEGPGATSIWTPADADSVIAVGAVDSCGVVQSFSSRGPTADGRIKPEICGRGRSTYWARASTNGFGAASGTSLSAPLIGGLTALLKEAHPTWNGAQLRAALIGTGTQAGNPDNAVGHGIARGLAALGFQASVPAPPRMTLPFRLLSPSNFAVTYDVTPTLLWSRSRAAIPGDHAVYRILLDDSAAFSSPETVLVGPDTTFTFPSALAAGSMHWWRVEAVGDLGYVRRSMNDRRFTVSSTLAVLPEEPSRSRFHLGPAHPNPMRAGTSFAVALPAGASAWVEILSISGRLVKRIDVVQAEAGREIAWDGTDAAGRRVPAGVYFVRLFGAPEVPARKLIVVR